MKIIITIAVVFFSFNCFSQDTAKVEQYCSVELKPIIFSKKVTMVIDYGGKRNDSTDTRVLNESGEPIKFNSFVDAINYMGKLGWTIAPGFPAMTGSTFVLRKEMTQGEANKIGAVPAKIIN